MTLTGFLRGVSEIADGTAAALRGLDADQAAVARARCVVINGHGCTPCGGGWLQGRGVKHAAGAVQYHSSDFGAADSNIVRPEGGPSLMAVAT